MPNFNIVKNSQHDNSYKVAKVKGLFDISDDESIENFVGEINIPTEWSIGAIVGPSGSGKTTIAKTIYKDDYYETPKFTNKSVIDDIDGDVSTITKTLNSVGFSSPMSWLKPYEVLSNGEKMRVQLVQALMSDKKLIVFDEYTSVVDRNVAKIGSYAIQKGVRRSNKQFIAVSCHYDIIDWLQPDWVFDTNTMQNVKKKELDQTYNLKYTESKDIGKCLANIII